MLWHPNSFLPLSTPPVLHIPVFDYTLAYTALKLTAVYVACLKLSSTLSYSRPFLVPTGSSIQPSILGKK